MSEKETKILRDIVSKGKSPARVVLHANILLAGDCSMSVKSIKEISESLSTTTTTMYNTLRLYKKKTSPLAETQKD